LPAIVPQGREAGKPARVSVPARNRRAEPADFGGHPASDTIAAHNALADQEYPVALAMFDLDNTLLAGDSDFLWGQHLVEQGVVDPEAYAAENRRFYQDYLDGTLDIQAFLAFSLRPLSQHEPDLLHQWRAQFIADKIDPIVLPAARELLAEHRRRGDTLLIITATNRFVTQPIADLLGVEHLLATEPELLAGRYTGRPTGTPTFREGKVKALQEWIARHGTDLDGSWFYSDSHNDLPLLERADHPVAVDPDPTLRRHAEQRGWPIISLRSEQK
jgi:HAD superfamily hydrolase (TIGR01490 family)